MSDSTITSVVAADAAVTTQPTTLNTVVADAAAPAVQAAAALVAAPAQASKKAKVSLRTRLTSVYAWAVAALHTHTTKSDKDIAVAKKSFLGCMLRAWRFTVFCVAWIAAVICRIFADVDRRRQVCDKVTRVAANGILESTTLRFIYVGLTAYTMQHSYVIQSWRWFVASLVLSCAAILVEFAWQVVLTVAAIIDANDSALESLGAAAVRQGAAIASKAEATLAAAKTATVKS
jgi:hypothetical protein